MERTLVALTKVKKQHNEASEIAEGVMKPTLNIVPKKQPQHDRAGHQTYEPRELVVTKIPDKVSMIFDDQILNEFRDLRAAQRDLVVGSGKIHNIPEGNEAFHKYAAKNGAVIGNTLDPETSKLMGEIEREKYKEIHKKYPHSDIDWSASNTASIKKDGVEFCKLSDKASSVPAEYRIGQEKITKYRNLDLPTKAQSGPMHISLAVKDLRGNNISAKDAVYFTAHYDKQGKLVEMTAPIPVYYTSEDKNSPVCIKRDGKIYTLPVNRGKYEEMMKTIVINKGLDVGLDKGAVAQDVIMVGQKPKAKDLIQADLVSKLKPYTASVSSTASTRNPNQRILARQPFRGHIF